MSCLESKNSGLYFLLTVGPVCSVQILRPTGVPSCSPRWHKSCVPLLPHKSEGGNFMVRASAATSHWLGSHFIILFNTSGCALFSLLSFLKNLCVWSQTHTHTKKIKILKLLFPLFWAFSWYFRRLVLATLLTAGRSESASVWNHQHFHWFILKTVLCFPNSGAERRISSTRMHGYLDPCAAVVCHVS